MNDTYTEAELKRAYSDLYGQDGPVGRVAAQVRKNRAYDKLAEEAAILPTHIVVDGRSGYVFFKDDKYELYTEQTAREFAAKRNELPGDRDRYRVLTVQEEQ